MFDPVCACLIVERFGHFIVSLYQIIWTALFTCPSKLLECCSPLFFFFFFFFFLCLALTGTWLLSGCGNPFTWLWSSVSSSLLLNTGLLSPSSSCHNKKLHVILPKWNLYIIRCFTSWSQLFRNVAFFACISLPDPIIQFCTILYMFIVEWLVTVHGMVWLKSSCKNF